jgi:hypothetical protein
MIINFNRFCFSTLSPLLLVVIAGVTPALAKECIDCHTEVAGSQLNGAKQMRGSSHHVQGVEISGRHCYACHWEATEDGRINEQYHPAEQSDKGKPRTVELVVWSEGERPTLYKSGSTAVTFQQSAIGTSSERTEIARVSTHCLGCHSDQNNNTLPFQGDANTPRKYAWDSQSVASRYSQIETVPWGKYSTAHTNRKNQLVKALSAHGNAPANQGGWSASSGYEGDIPISRGGSGAKNIECFDCHNSHGSTVTGVTTSYRTSDGSYNGGILKETVAGKGGYPMNYKPSSNSDAQSNNPYNPGAGLCFDCHETAVTGVTPWGYNSTFGASQPIIGYKDTLRFGSGSKGSSSRYANRKGRTEINSSHLKAGKFLSYSAHEKIGGLCTPCHDPHGVSRTLGDKMAYAVPLLKGTWLTSPYREDAPPAGPQGRGGNAPRDADKTGGKSNFNSTNRDANANFGKGDSGAPVADTRKESDYNTTNRDANSNFGKGGSGAPVAGAWKEGDFNSTNRNASANFGKGGSDAPKTAVRDQGDFNTTNRNGNSNFSKSGSGSPREPMAGMKYNVDRNTFGDNNRVSENDDTFAGLCLKCHSKGSFSGDNKSGKIHRAVKGWGNNKEHAFPCSKCHQAHNSGLPRLMQTNCFEAGPSGLREKSGLPWLPVKKGEDQPAVQSGQKPVDSSNQKSSRQVVGCHVRQFGGSSTKQESTEWNEKTTW